MATYSAIKYNVDLPTASTTLKSGNALELIQTVTASSSSNLTFVHGTNSVVFDSTYRTYIFRLINLHVSNDNERLKFQSTTNGSDFNVTMTATQFSAGHDEGETYSSGSLAYDADADKQQSTGTGRLARGVSSDNDHSINGELMIFSPADTTFKKHFTSRTSANDRNDFEYDHYFTGYFNTTTALTGMKFEMSNGNIDSGQIKFGFDL